MNTRKARGRIPATLAGLLLGVSAAASSQQGVCPETEALRRFHPDYAWQGTVHEGVLWKGSPEVQTLGRATFRWVLDGKVVVGDFVQDDFLAGLRILTWKAHYTAGWDAGAGRYRAVIIDGYGWGAASEVTVEEDRYVMVSPAHPTGEGSAVSRAVLRVTGPGTFAWTKEVSENGSEWRVTEEATAHVVGAAFTAFSGTAPVPDPSVRESWPLASGWPWSMGPAASVNDECGTPVHERSR